MRERKIEKYLIKSPKQMIMVIAVFTLMIFVGGTTYAFFNYTRTGGANTIRVGRISFVTRQTKTISLTNLFPIDPTNSEEISDEEKVGTLEIEIEGDTDYAQGVEYLVSSENTHITTSSGKVVPISLDVTVTNLGTENNNYFTAREDKNATIYKKLVGNVLSGDQMLLVGFIKPNTTSGTIEGVNGKITIKAYLDKNKIGISDTYNGTESDNMGTTNEWAKERTIFKTEEWNAISSTGVSFQVKVEANEGIWVESLTPDENCFTTEDNVDGTVTITKYNAGEKFEFNQNITQEEVNTCISYLTSEWGENNFNEGETYETFCNGTGTNYGATFQERLDNNYFDANQLDYFVEHNIIIFKSRCDSKSVIIPNTINGKMVTEIGDEAFTEGRDAGEWIEYSADLENVVIPYGIKKIGRNAFSGNKLENIEIPSSVTTIASAAFFENQLTSVTIPSSITTIGDSAFSGNQLTSITIPSSITTIGDSAFASNQLTSVTIPNSVTTIGGYAFCYNQLTSVTIPNSVTTIGDGAFLYNQLTSITIPNSVTTIGGYAFEHNQLTSITIPNSVTTIASDAFSDNQLTSVTIPNSVTTIGYNAFGSNQLTSITIPNSVTTIGGSAFSNNQLTNVTIGNGITSVGLQAFYKNTWSNPNLTTITMDKACSSMSNYSDWTRGTNITIYGANNEVCYTK